MEKHVCDINIHFSIVKHVLYYKHLVITNIFVYSEKANTMLYKSRHYYINDFT